MQISVELENLRHSHIFTLKQIVRKFPGSQPTLLVFTKDGAKIATVIPDPDYYISDDYAAFQKELEQAQLPMSLIFSSNHA